jgi:hypothetical protein
MPVAGGPKITTTGILLEVDDLIFINIAQN